MSYTSEHILPKGTSLRRVRELLKLLGYRRVTLEIGKIPNAVGHYFWFESKEYKSNTGVELGIYEERGELSIQTRTPVARSYWDLEVQNQTLKLLRETFGGDFRTDAGKNRYYRNEGKAPSPSESGCKRAFSAFGSNLIRADFYLMTRSFPEHVKPGPVGLWIIDSMNPRTFSNHLVLVYLLAVLEDFFKSTYVALLTYSTRRGDILKSMQLTASQAAEVSAGALSLEEAFVEGAAFSRPSTMFKHFARLDPSLKLDNAVRKPVGRRKQRLDEEFESLVELRNLFVHRAGFDVGLSDGRIERIADDVELVATRCAKRIFAHHRWTLEPSWFRLSSKNRRKVQQAKAATLPASGATAACT